MRGPFLRWLFFYGSSFEPAVVDRAMKRDPAPLATSPYGDFETMFNTVRGQLAKGPYILGERFSAADILWGSALTWITGFKLIPETPEVMAYVARINARPAVAATAAKDAALAATHEHQAGP